ncbi:MAG: hypothetical protein HY785_13980 [Oscillatoriophycideae cyanobacterium NC_groundwater_1537_Pr4_S-0.65um_50_18]|nr:hypothetical protein [Oscillatoriophycideae cyanobacterium NC_groundwater_1537_Pr4_S-0.65um_50_18]
MGQYEVCDFVLLLLAYAVSGLDTLQSFFEQLKSVQSIVMSVWQRQHCPVASTLSRFLQAIDSGALEQLRTLFEADLLEHGFAPIDSGGLIDRAGNRFWIFDVDGTHQQLGNCLMSTTFGSSNLLVKRSRSEMDDGDFGNNFLSNNKTLTQ